MPRAFVMRLTVLVAMAVSCSAPAAGGRGAANAPLSPHARVKRVGLRDVRWTRGFWAEKYALCRSAMIPTVYGALQNPKNAAVLENFRVAAGLEKGKHLGTNWGDGDCYKFLETLAYVYAATGDETLDRLMDDWIAAIAGAQAADGYLSTNIQLTGRKRFANPHHHEMYNMGHLLTAATVHHRATGKDTFLAVARKLGDFLYETFGPRPPELAHFGWNPSNIMGLVDLYRTTGDPKYLKLAGIFVDMRGSTPGGTDLTQDRVALRKETEAVGHCVCAGYLYCGAADVAAETGETALGDALERIWLSATGRRMYITGAVGSFRNGKSTRGDPVHEAFGADYELPSRTAYNETCANIASAMWNRRMLALTGDARYADVMEQVLYNSMLSAVGADGKGFFYANPLARDDRRDGLSKHHTARRWAVHTCYCCPPQVTRTIAKLHTWAYGVSGKGVWVHLYGGSTVTTRLSDGSPVSLTQETAYPWDGRVKMTVTEAPASAFAVMLRIPGWANGARVTVNGKALADVVEPGTYVVLRRKWAAGDVIELDMPMRVRLMVAHPKVKDLRGRVALMRGPVVYCLESPDLPKGVDVSDVAIPAGITFVPHVERNLLGGVTVLRGKAAKARARRREPPAADEGMGKNLLYTELKAKKAQVAEGDGLDVTLIPYFAWANRGASHMTVWMPLAGRTARGE